MGSFSNSSLSALTKVQRKSRPPTGIYSVAKSRHLQCYSYPYEAIRVLSRRRDTTVYSLSVYVFKRPINNAEFSATTGPLSWLNFYIIISFRALNADK